MATSSFNLTIASQAAPYIWGSMQDVSGMTIEDKGMPFVIAQDMPGTSYVTDTRGRLTNANLTSAKGLAYNLDNGGNRTSTVSS